MKEFWKRREWKENLAICSQLIVKAGFYRVFSIIEVIFDSFESLYRSKQKILNICVVYKVSIKHKKKKKILILRVAKDAKYLRRLRPGNSKGKIITLDWFQDEIRAGRYPKLQRRHVLPFSPLNSKGTGHYCIHDNSQVCSITVWQNNGEDVNWIPLLLHSTWLANSFDTPLWYLTAWFKRVDSSLAICRK